MKTPWYLNVHRQSAVLNRIANRFYNLPAHEFKTVLDNIQTTLWSKFDNYNLKMKGGQTI